MRRLLPALAALPLLLVACSASTGTPAASSSAPASSPSAASAASGDLPTELSLDLSQGTVAIALDAAAPKTVAAQTKLAQEGYFDGTPCHRLTTKGIFVLQCGDPTGTGSGGPGYQLPDENLPSANKNNYPAGTVAMANAGPNTGGSQFFIVYEDTSLPPGYTIWGEVTSGLDVVQKIAADGTKTGAPDGPPKSPVTIESTTVS